MSFSFLYAFVFLVKNYFLAFRSDVESFLRIVHAATLQVEVYFVFCFSCFDAVDAGGCSANHNGMEGIMESEIF